MDEREIIIHGAKIAGLILLVGLVFVYLVWRRERGRKD